MKLILTQEVAGLGAPGDVVEVKDGYGRNYLDPARLRDPLDPWRREADRVDQAGRDVREIRDLGQANEVKGQLERLASAAGRAPASRSAVRRRSPSPTSPTPSRPAARPSTSAASRSASRSRPSARTRSPSGCTPRSPRRVDVEVVAG